MTTRYALSGGNSSLGLNTPRTRPLRVPLLLLAMLIALLAGSCGSKGTADLGLEAGAQAIPAAEAPGGMQLAWPPSGESAVMPDHGVSATDTYPLEGSLFNDSSGNVTANGNSAVFITNLGLPWATYSLGGFSEDAILSEISIQFNATVNEQDDSAGMWFAVANWSSLSWEWYSASPTNFSFTPAVSTDYVSPTGFVHVAAVLEGTGQGVITRLDFTRTGDAAIPEAPVITGGSATFYSCTIQWDPVPGAVGYLVYRTANPELQAPQRITTSPVTELHYTDLGVNSETEYHYGVAAVRQAIGTLSDLLPLTTLTEALTAPTNLTVTPDVGTVTLSWSPVEGASGYNVYRSTKTNLSNEFKVNVAAIKGANYLDIDPQGGLINYYRVAAVRSNEGPKSEVASCFVPLVDLSAPQNLRLVSAVADEATVAWDWEGTNPGKFRLMVKQIPDFQIEPPYFHLAVLDGGIREHHFTGLQTGELYYVRVCATSISNQPGQMSETLEIEADGYWTLGPPEVLGLGEPQLQLLSEEDDLTAAYFNGVDVMVARRDGINGWTTEPVLSGDFTNFVSMARLKVPGGDYMVCSVMADPLDLHGAVGRPGEGWVTELIDGDGTSTENNLFTPENGFYVQVAASDDEFAVSHMEVIYLNEGPPFPETNQMVYQSRPAAGGPWTRDYIVTEKTRQPINMSMAELGGDFFILLRDLDTPGFNFGSSTDTFASWMDISTVPTDVAGVGNDLERFGSGWASPSCNDTTAAMELYTESGGTWTSEVLNDQLGTPDRSRMAVSGNDLFIVCRVLSRAAWQQFFYDGETMTWDEQPMFLPQGVVSQRMDVAALDGNFYLLYDNPLWDEIHCAVMVPPAP